MFSGRSALSIEGSLSADQTVGGCIKPGGFSHIRGVRIEIVLIERVIARGYSPWGPLREDYAQKVIFFRLRVHQKVGISLAEVYKRIGKYEIVKGPMAVKKSRKLRGLMIYSNLKDSAFTRVSKVKGWLGMWDGYNLSIEGIRRGCTFLSKMLYKRVRVWTLGWRLPVK